MSKLLIATLLATSATLAAAAPQTVEVTGKSLRAVTPHEAIVLAGHYRLDDGRMLRLVKAGSQLRAEVDGTPVADLLAVSSSQLRSADGRMSLRVAYDEVGEASDIVLVTERRA